MVQSKQELRIQVILEIRTVMNPSLLPKPPSFSPQNNKLNVTQLTFVSVHLTAVGDERHLLRPAHVLVPDCT